MTNPHAAELMRRLRAGMEHVSLAEMRAKAAEASLVAGDHQAAQEHAKQARLQAEEGRSELRILASLIEEMG